MSDQAACTAPKLSRPEISDDVTRRGWRYNLGLVRTSVPVGSPGQAAEVVQVAIATAGGDADGSLTADLTPTGPNGPGARPAYGDRDRWNPEVELTAALSQCHLLSYLHVCERRSRRDGLL